jgi:EAL domain-containing protein (putative c-di-GMP-specific phosphodiesterase class I)
VVGEGVETQEQLTLLRHLRCDLVQGFLLGHPASADAARQWLWQLAAQRGEARAQISG